jgi:hypothetical protein
LVLRLLFTGKSDPFVEVFTTNDHRGKTRYISNSLSPQWDEVRRQALPKGRGARVFGQGSQGGR